MKRVASPGSMHDTGCLGLVHWDDPEGWNGEGGARAAPGKSGLHARGEGERVLALDLNGVQPPLPFGEMPGESQGRRSLVGRHLWGRKESDTTEVT